jgi:23S rRNA G2445 N2-methylase RlmL
VTTFFASCPPGLEPVLHAEVKELAFARHERQVGGVRFDGNLETAWRANLRLATATRVLERLGRFEAGDELALYKGVQSIDWSPWVGPTGSLWVNARTKESALEHSRFIEQKVKDAIVDQFRAQTGERPSVERENADLRIDLHLFRDRATLSIDLSGEALYKRGWRRHQGRAPLNECLAAGIARLAEWDRRAPLIDPFCGSGTLLIEAGLMLLGRAPGGLGRGFAFERLPRHSAVEYAAWRATELRPVAPPGRLPRLLGFDSDPQRVREARENVAAAGLEPLITIECQSALKLDLRPGWNAWIVTNPPYGERIGEGRETRALLEAFGQQCRNQYRGYRFAILSGGSDLTRALGLKVSARHSLDNGGLPVELLLGEC